MTLRLPSGKYVAAISGGVDSMVLLDLLMKLNDIELTVAHFDHGIRSDSSEDRLLVQAAALRYGLKFEFAEANLGTAASEATARTARYNFLNNVKLAHGAAALVTAHHQDDVLETVVINMARGTGRRGLTSLASTADIKRPLLNNTKAELVFYAKKHNLQWREDSTNTDQKQLRNYVRHSVMPRFSLEDRNKLLAYIQNTHAINKELDEALNCALGQLGNAYVLDRAATAQLPCNVIKELLTVWWRNRGFLHYDTKTLQRALHDIRAGQTGAVVPLKKPYYMTIERHKLALHIQER